MSKELNQAFNLITESLEKSSTDLYHCKQLQLQTVEEYNELKREYAVLETQYEKLRKQRNRLMLLYFAVPSFFRWIANGPGFDDLDGDVE